MRAAVRDRYGPPDVVELRESAKPEAADGEVLVRVRATSVNPADWYEVSGTPYFGRIAGGLRRPKSSRLGTDFAGTVEAVGKDVTQFRPGDEVFGGRSGAFAEYVTVPEDRAIVPKPAGVSFEQAAAMPIAGLTALQGLRDKGGIQAGKQVLVNGASGGVGTFAVQIAKSFGAEVTGVCSTRNVELVRSLGADHVVDYTREDFTRGGRRYDIVLDVAGSRSWSEIKRVLDLHATVVLVGHEPMLGALLAHMLGSAQAGRLAFKKGGAALVDLPDGPAAPGRLIWFLDPRVLRTLADRSAITRQISSTNGGRLREGKPS